MNLINKTKTWLLDNNILVPDDWVSACIEWIQEENQGVSQTQEQINSLVYEQWLLADLHELGTRCLPSSALTADKFQLSGNYALQIDSILDVGQSFYSQQQKVRGTENANVGVSAEEKTYKPWEQKPTRMLMFKLTDGTQTVQGMEYKPVRCLTPQTQPGAKILVYGSLMCRHGVLMLGENNIQFLGGEVDSLVEANTPLNTLESAMAASTENAGKSHRQEFEGSALRHTQQPDNKSAVHRSTGQQKFGQGLKLVNQSQSLKQAGALKKEVQVNKVQQIHSTVDDQWEDDQMFDALMDDMETDDFEEAPNYSSHVKPEPGVRRPTSLDTNRAGANSAFGSRAQSNLSRGNDQNFYQSRGDNNSRYQSRGDNRKRAISGNDENVKREVGVIVPKKEIITYNKIQANSVGRTDLSSNPNKRQRTAVDVDVGFDEEDCFGSEDCFDEDMDFSDISELEQFDMERIKRRDNPSYELHQANSTHTSVSGETYSNQNAKSVPSNWCATNSEKCLKVSVKTEPVKDNGGRLKQEINGIQIERDSAASVDRLFSSSRTNSKNTAASTESSSNYETDSTSDYPYTYLSKVLLKRPVEPKIVTVKAYISTLTSKLSRDTGKWSLSCKINDGTMACDVDLSDTILKDFIGFSAEDAKEMKIRAERDKSVRVALQKGIQQCQQKLVELMCLMEVDISAKNDKPVIVAVKDITSKDIELLYNRVLSSRNCYLY